MAVRIGKDGFGKQNDFILPIQQFLLGVLPKEAGVFIDPDAKVGPKEALAAISIVFTLANVAQTKGAISEMEMRLFQRAAPFLGQTYEGFMLALDIQEQVAKKKIQFADEYSSEYEKLITNNPDMEERKIHSHMLERYEKAMKADRDRNLTLSNQAITQSLGPTGTMKKNLITAGIDKNTVDRMTDEQTKQMHERLYGTSL